MGERAERKNGAFELRVDQGRLLRLSAKPFLALVSHQVFDPRLTVSPAFDIHIVALAAKAIAKFQFLDKPKHNKPLLSRPNPTIFCDQIFSHPLGFPTELFPGQCAIARVPFGSKRRVLRGIEP